jgi:hypothetical protein
LPPRLPHSFEPLFEDYDEVIDLYQLDHIANELEVRKIATEAKENLSDSRKKIEMFGDKEINSKKSVTLKSELKQIGILYPAIKKDYLLQLLQGLSEVTDKSSIIFFDINGLFVEEQQIQGYGYSEGKLQCIISDMPPVIYNLSTFTKMDHTGKLRRLRLMSGVSVINPINHFQQDILLEMISSFTDFKEMLLPFATFSESSLHEFLMKYKTIFFLPQKAEKAAFAMILSVDQQQGCLLQIGTKQFNCKLEDIFKYMSKIIRHKKYLMTKGFMLLTEQNIPVECRVYVQKGSNKLPVLTATTLKRSAFSNEALLPATSAEKILNKVSLNEVHKFCLQTSEYLDYYLPNLGSCYFDFVFDLEGKPYFIHFGGIEKESFLSNTNRELWTKYIRNVFEYAYSRQTTK